MITHAHSDHISGLQTLLKKTSFPILASGRACRELDYRLAGIRHRLQEVPGMEEFSLGQCTVTGFPTSHDAPGSFGYRLESSDGSLGVLTDTGYVTPEAREVLLGVDTAVLETTSSFSRASDFALATISGWDARVWNRPACFCVNPVFSITADFVSAFSTPLSQMLDAKP